MALKITLLVALVSVQVAGLVYVTSMSWFLVVIIAVQSMPVRP